MPYALLLAISGALHFIWEANHVQLYTGYEHVARGLPIPWYATAGDIVYTFFALLVIALFKHEIAWWQKMTWHDAAVLACLGLVIALFVEYKAFLFGRWAYTAAMPIIPIVQVGLSPVLQMMILLPVSVLLAGALVRRITNKT